MRKLLAFSLSVIVISMFLFSCDKETAYYTRIKNNSSKIIKIFPGLEDKALYGDSIILPPSADKLIYEYTEKGKDKDFEFPAFDANGLNVDVQDNLSLVKDITKPENWDVTSNSDFSTWTSIFQINDSDLQ